jgi:hypothetical protein
MAAEGAARIADTPGQPDTSQRRAGVVDTHTIQTVLEPETRAGIAPAARQISLKLATDESTRVNIEFTEKAGKIQVAVRTPDQELAKSLQTDLGNLVGRLESKGFKTESWLPAPHQTTVAPQPSNSNSGFGQPHHSGSGAGAGQQRQHPNSPNQRQQARWTAQLKQTLSASEVRSENQ